MAFNALKWFALCHVFAGLILSTLIFIPATHAFVLGIIYPNGPTADASELMYWVSVFGPTIASWGLIYYALLMQYQKDWNPGLYRILWLALLIWAPLDTFISAYQGITIGIWLNGFVCAAFAILLYQVRPLNRKDSH